MRGFSAARSGRRHEFVRHFRSRLHLHSVLRRGWRWWRRRRRSTTTAFSSLSAEEEALAHRGGGRRRKRGTRGGGRRPTKAKWCQHGKRGLLSQSSYREELRESGGGKGEWKRTAARLRLRLQRPAATKVTQESEWSSPRPDPRRCPCPPPSTPLPPTCSGLQPAKAGR